MAKKQATNPNWQPLKGKKKTLTIAQVQKLIDEAEEQAKSTVKWIWGVCPYCGAVVVFDNGGVKKTVRVKK